jgi:hypothetical protein
MNYFLGVIKNKPELKPGEKSYWCVYKNSNSEIGDILFMYETGVGIVQIYKIISEPSITGEFKCELRRMLTVDTELTTDLPNPVSIATMKKDQYFGDAGPVRRNFQAALFNLNEESGDALLRLIKNENPGLEIHLN